MSYLPSHTPVGELTEDESRYVDYVLPKERFALERKRFEHRKRVDDERLDHDRKMAKWDKITAFATGVIPVISFFGIASWLDGRRR